MGEKFSASEPVGCADIPQLGPIVLSSAVPLTFTNYSLRKAAPVGWTWEADYQGREFCKGYCLTKRAARWKARSWLRLRRAQSRRLVALGAASLAPDPEP